MTRILTERGRDHDAILAAAIQAVYSDLRAIAGRLLAAEKRTPTFDTESLIHEVYLVLHRQERTRWRNRRHFFAIAVRLMRRILVDRARRVQAAKRGGGIRMTTLEHEEIEAASRRLDVLVLDDALEDLGRSSPDLAQLVELRFFGGLSNPEIAEVQGVTTMTVIRRWRLARAWLHSYLEQEGEAGD